MDLVDVATAFSTGWPSVAMVADQNVIAVRNQMSIAKVATKDRNGKTIAQCFFCELPTIVQFPSFAKADSFQKGIF